MKADTMTGGALITTVLRERQDDGELRTQAVVATWEGQRRFIPAELPCGDCGPCRRGKVSGCMRVRAWGAEARPGGVTPADLPQRFAYDLPAELPAEKAVWAAVVAPFIEAMGRAGLGAGDLSLWLGTNPMALLGASLAAAKGSQSLLLGPRSLESLMAELPSGDDAFDARPRFLSWNELDADALSGLIEVPGGLVEKQVYVVTDDPMAWTAAGQLLSFGTTIVGFGGIPALAGLPGESVALALGTRCHPDFVPESLATLATHAAVFASCSLLALGGAYEVALADPS